MHILTTQNHPRRQGMSRPSLSAPSVMAASTGNMAHSSVEPSDSSLDMVPIDNQQVSAKAEATES